MDYRFSPFGRLGDMKISVSPDRPRYKLPADLPLPPAFREQFDAWAVDFFGVANVIADGEVLHEPQRGMLHMNPRTLAKLKEAMHG